MVLIFDTSGLNSLLSPAMKLGKSRPAAAHELTGDCKYVTYPKVTCWGAKIDLQLTKEGFSMIII